MAVAPRETKKGKVYRVATKYKNKVYFEPAGKDWREAKRLSERRKKEAQKGTFVPPAARSGGITVSAYAERFFAARTNRNSESEQQQVESHALAIPWFADKPMEDVRPPDFLDVIKELRQKTKTVKGVEKRALTEKSIANIMGTVRTMFGDAHFREVIPSNPFVLPRKTLRRKSRARPSYHGAEVLALLSDKVASTRRVFIWLAFFTGMREGEVCGRRWRDWIRDAKPLTALLCTSQYDDQPLKGDEEEGGDARPRVIPVHPELAQVLEWWWNEGWEVVHCRKPELDDFIFPSRQCPEKNLTRSAGYKLWLKACADAGVRNRSLHSTRHTFTTFARRGTARTDAIEAITHNSKGEMVDYYNHWLWTPLCEAMSPLSFKADADEAHPLDLMRRGTSTPNAGPVSSPPTTTEGGVAPMASAASASTRGGAGSPTSPHAPVGVTRSAGSEAALAPLAGTREVPVETPESLPKGLPGSPNYPKSLWRRRELNPGPRGIQKTFVHVRSRRIPGG